MLVDTSFLLVYVHDVMSIKCVSICIGEVDVGADLSRLTHCLCLAELAQGQTFGPWESN